MQTDSICWTPLADPEGNCESFVILYNENTYGFILPEKSHYDVDEIVDLYKRYDYHLFYQKAWTINREEVADKIEKDEIRLNPETGMIEVLLEDDFNRATA